MECDFSGYVTKYNTPCTDGLKIMSDAFKHMDGKKVPLVWQHQHNSPENVLGYTVLEHRADGVYGRGFFNSTPMAVTTKTMLQHGDVESMSIHANRLVKRSKSDVQHGDIKEVSLVLAGANPGALIDFVAFNHGDDIEVLEDEAFIYTGLGLEYMTTDEDSVEHAANTNQGDTTVAPTATASDQGETVQDVFDTLSEKQKNVVYYLIGQAVDGADNATSQSDDDEDYIQHDDQEGQYVTRNVFEGDSMTGAQQGPTLSHDQLKSIMADAKKYGSFKESFLEHAGEYGVTNIDFLFPDAKTITDSPTFISRRMEWVTSFLDGTTHTPFARIKSVQADITAAEARAKGYTKGARKVEEVIRLLKRVTTPTTVYKKQKLDRDDIIDITDLDVVSWLKAEMRLMLDEEVARAGLIGDGRLADDPDKIDETNIRPIYSEDPLYAIRHIVDANTTVAEMVDEVVVAQAEYKGQGTPNFYATKATITSMLLLRDTLGRRLYGTKAELASAIGVKDCIAVDPMSGISRTDATAGVVNLVGIVVNPADYTFGADKGGAIGMFDDFDIDYNQNKYLIETRLSGALKEPYTAVVIEKKSAGAVAP